MSEKLKGYLSPLSKEAETSTWIYFKEWFSSTDAKRIGVMYIILAIFMGIVGLLESFPDGWHTRWGDLLVRHLLVDQVRAPDLDALLLGGASSKHRPVP